jgi:two-component system OmpR family sensor kinase/two-component system sensor histidine kinase BaeS
VSTHPLPPHAIRHIRRRLIALVALTTGGLLVVLSILTLGSLVWFFGRIPFSENPFIPTELVDALQIYYQAKGSWGGVGEAFKHETDTGRRFNFAEQWDETILIDQNGRVLVERGSWTGEQIGTQYIPNQDDTHQYPIVVEGKQVGTVIYTGWIPQRKAFVAVFFVVPTCMVTIFGGLLTFLIGVVLTRRIVIPLAEVIATAQEVAAGDLSARVNVHGASDIRLLSDSFNHMADALEHNDTERRNMLADIAHELRTPLTIMRGSVEGILDGVYSLTEKQVAQVLQEVYILDHLVEDLRLLTLAETRQLPLNLQPVHLGDIAQNTLRLFEAEAAEKQMILRGNIPPDLPLVDADPHRIEQVIANLLSNALRHSPEVTGQITLSLEQTPNGVKLIVSDNGPGIPASDLPHLFDRFWRGDKSRARSSGGAGLGLAITKQLIAMHGGTIGVESVPGEGSTFWFTLKTK